MAAQNSIPVTIVTGFLGAGKTTLLNKVLKLYGEDKNIAVIENEFGEVNLDSQLVYNQLKSKEHLVKISNGCVCCSLRKDILSALSELEKRSKEAGQPYDNIIIETTGLADPAPVAFTFFTNPWAKQRYHLDSILTVVDAKYLHRQLMFGNAHSSPLKISFSEETTGGKDSNHGDSTHAIKHQSINEVVNQIAFADMVLLNKIDLVTDEDVIEVEQAVREMNMLARVVHTRLNDEDTPNWLGLVLDNKRFCVERALEIDPHFLESASSSDEDEEDPGSGNDDSEARQETPSKEIAQQTVAKSSPNDSSELSPEQGGVEPADRNTSDVPRLVKKPRKMNRIVHDLVHVRSVCVTLPGELDTYLFNMFMRDLLQERGKDIFRSKGTLCVHGHSRVFNFQGVHETFQLSQCQTLANVDAPRSEMVFIGLHLDKNSIREGLLSCLWRPLPDGWKEYYDKKTSRTYYVNTVSGEKSWRRPTFLNPEAQQADREAFAAAQATGAKRAILSEASVQQPRTVRPRQS